MESNVRPDGPKAESRTGPPTGGTSARVKWYLTPVAIMIAILAIGPFAIPFVWMSPALKRWHKVVITIGLVLLTLWAVKSAGDMYNTLLKELRDLQAVLK